MPLIDTRFDAADLRTASTPDLLHLAHLPREVVKLALDRHAAASKLIGFAPSALTAFPSPSRRFMPCSRPCCVLSSPPLFPLLPRLRERPFCCPPRFVCC